MENNGKGIFYGVIGVATLIVAIIGATFAYFTATANDTSTIQGNAATVSLGLSVTKISNGNKGLVPQKEATLSSAMKGKDNTANSGNDMCIDGNDNTVCQVYKITVNNTGTGDAKLKGTLDLNKGSITNLKWALVDGETLESAPALDGSAKLDNVIVESLTLSGSGTQDYYVIVWIDETGSPQGDTGEFTGTVSFNNAGGGEGVTSTFVS